MNEPKRLEPEEIKAVFEHIAPQYDRMNDLISYGRHRRWKKKLVQRSQKLCAGLSAPSALDICCGSGDIALLLAHSHSFAQVSGIDFSPHMLELARRRAEEQCRHTRSFRLDCQLGGNLVLLFRVVHLVT